jgi:hypothetical protein
MSRVNLHQGEKGIKELIPRGDVPYTGLKEIRP